jgi:hypothetical protein
MAINRYCQNTDVSTEERVSGQLECVTYPFAFRALMTLSPRSVFSLVFFSFSLLFSRILDILKEWVMLHGSQFIDDTPLHDLRTFLQQIASQKGTEVKARDLLLIMERSSVSLIITLAVCC